MFRPLTMFGAFVIGFSILSYLFVPRFSNSTAGLVVLIFCIVAGGLAIAKDLRDLWKEVQKQQKKDGDQ